jgi:hypothetical protein
MSKIAKRGEKNPDRRNGKAAKKSPRHSYMPDSNRKSFGGYSKERTIIFSALSDRGGELSASKAAAVASWNDAA